MPLQQPIAGEGGVDFIPFEVGEHVLQFFFVAFIEGVTGVAAHCYTSRKGEEEYDNGLDGGVEIFVEHEEK